MTSPRATFWQVAAITVLVLHGSARASESPLAVIRSTVERAVAVQHAPTPGGVDRQTADTGRAAG